MVLNKNDDIEKIDFKTLKLNEEVKTILKNTMRSALKQAYDNYYRNNQDFICIKTASIATRINILNIAFNDEVKRFLSKHIKKISKNTKMNDEYLTICLVN